MIESMDMSVTPVTVQAQTVSKLRNAILTGVFPPGSRLVEADLCQRMNVSRTSVREALRRLEAERLVTLVPNKGPVVTDVTWEEARQIYDVRALLEGEATALFAARAGAGELRELSAALAEFDRAVSDGDAIGRLAATSRFYEIILKGCGNRVIAELLNGLVARITFLRARSMSRSGRSESSAAELRRIVEAVETGSIRQARAAAIRHVRSACAAAAEMFASGREGEPASVPARRTAARPQPTTTAR